MTTDVCQHRASGKDCPISRTPCLGECIYANILDDINLGIIGFDITKREVFFQNKYAVQIFKETINPKDYAALSGLLLSEIVKTPYAESRVRLGDSRTLQYGKRFIGYSIYFISDTYLWLYLTDITEKMRLNAIAEAVDTMNNLGYIFSGIRHELGNPINSIKMTLTVCKKNLASYSKETIAEFIDRVLSDVTRVEGLLKDLKNFSLYEHAECREVPLQAFLDNLLAIAGHDLSAKNIQVKTTVRQGAEQGWFDARALQHVMLNILTNAMDALEGSPYPEIGIAASRLGDRVLLKVKDNGKGIPADQKQHLFQPFSTTKSHGTGLGLVIAKKMLLRMGGEIEIESEEGAGTIVTLSLPASG